MSKTHIASALKRLRISSGLTADELGTKIGKSGKTVNAWENNRGQPDADKINEIAKFFGVTDNFLLGFGVFKNWEEIFSKKNVIIEILYTTLPQLKQFDLSNDIIFICILDSIIEKIEIDGNNIKVCFKTYFENFSESKAVEKNQLSVQEKQYIEQYRILDEYGKKAVDSVLNVEYERCIQTQHHNSKIS